MKQGVAMVEVWRGGFAESVHSGHAVVCDRKGNIMFSLGDPDAVILPRSSAKMIQALPLIESGAADSAGLGTEHLALACASHQGAPEHTGRVSRWLDDLGLSDADLRCGPEFPRDEETAHAMIRAHGHPSQGHNNCSGKHAGFLTLTRHLGAGPEYVDPDHPVQIAVRGTFEDVTGQPSPGYGIDGCSAPNFATTVAGLARAMSVFAAAGTKGTARDKAATRLRDAMMAHPGLVAGEGRACTELMRAMNGTGALKTGAEGVFVAILPGPGLGLALKIADGATRASECALAALLVQFGALDPNHPATILRRNPPIINRRGIVTGELRPVDGVFRL